MTKWDASRLILIGEHCPADVVRKTVTTVMKAAGGARAIHVAFNDQTVVDTLCFAVGTHLEELGAIDQLLFNADFQRSSKKLLPLCLNAAQNLYDAVSWIDDDYVVELVAALQSIPRYSRSHRNRQLLLSPFRHGIYLDNMGGTKRVPEQADLRSILLLDERSRSKVLLRRSVAVKELAMQLKSTSEASALKDSLVTKQVGDRLNRKESDGDEALDFESFAESAVQLAIDVTRSDAGAVYIVTGSTPTHFELVTSHSRRRLPARIRRDHSGPMQSALSQGRAVQRNNWWPSRRSWTSDEPPGASLLSPIGGPAGDPWGHAVGTLILFRDNHEPYSAYDLALAHNVALRLALARTTDVMARIGTSITTLRTKRSWDAVRSQRPGATVLGDIVLPQDVTWALHRIRPALAELGQVSDSHSATLRLAIPSAQSGASHGLSLVRVASWPNEPLDDDAVVQRQADGGFNWRCFVEGRAVYSRDVTDDTDYLRVRPDTVSELCYPIRLEGMVIGSLNLESPLFDAYSVLRPLVGAFCGAVGRTFADARAATEQDVIDGAAQALDHRHTMDSTLFRLRSRLRSQSNSGIGAIDFEDDMDLIQAELDAMRQIDAISAPPESTIPEILSRAAERVGYLGDLPDPNSNVVAANAIVRNERVWALETSIANVLSNVINYTAPSLDDRYEGPLRSISYDTTRLEGRLNLVVTIVNIGDGAINRRKIANLYRAPVPDGDGKLRVGGFLAGLNARRADARIHSYVGADGLTLTTILLIPLEGSAPTW